MYPTFPSTPENSQGYEENQPKSESNEINANLNHSVPIDNQNIENKPISDQIHFNNLPIPKQIISPISQHEDKIEQKNEQIEIQNEIPIRNPLPIPSSIYPTNNLINEKPEEIDLVNSNDNQFDFQQTLTPQNENILLIDNQPNVNSQQINNNDLLNTQLPEPEIGTNFIQQEEKQSEIENSQILNTDMVNLNDQIHPINIPIETIYGADRNLKNDLIFTVKFCGFNKFERVTNSDMKKYHQQELIEFYESCMTFVQPIDMPQYKPR